jgi:hypothetical protein
MPAVFCAGIAGAMNDIEDIGVLAWLAKRKGIKLAKTAAEDNLLILR